MDTSKAWRTLRWLLGACTLATLAAACKEDAAAASVDAARGGAERDAELGAPAADAAVGGERDADTGQASRDAAASDARDASANDAAAHDAGGNTNDDAGPGLGAVSIAWDGDTHAGGAGWSAPNSNPVATQAVEAHAGNALHWHVLASANPWSEWGWNWAGFQKPGTDISSAKYFVFYIKLDGAQPPSDMTISLRSGISEKYAHQPPASGGLRGVSLAAYAPSFADKTWQQVRIPLADMLSGENAADFESVYEVFIGAGGNDYDLYLDDIGFAE